MPALLLLGTLPALPATLPLLDFLVGDGRAAVESQHHPDSHGFPHNHLICIQQQASFWAAPNVSPVPVAEGALSLPPPLEPVNLPFQGPIRLPRSRAPPVA